MATLTITWPDDTIEQDKADFLRAAPNQTLDSETPLTDLQWIKKKIELMIKGQVMTGRRERIEAEMSAPDEPIIEVN